ncbi:hypothetical protein [Treponema zioleckii]|uniref:hypothetical protein n=1 Tax=Treponema zioleckii TaxID=331680 RepID=UPI00168B4F48|nr:hypothetical protein [Treponema zioleckii]
MKNDYTEPRKPQAVWEPGTLDNTRKNIGVISEEEAKKMTKILGGEIFTEKSAPINYDAFPRNREMRHTAVGGRKSNDLVTGNKTASAGSGDIMGYAVPEQKPRYPTLPELTQKERALMDKTMMSDDYRIKSNYGVFNFVRRFKKNGLEQVRKGFIEYDIPKSLDHYNEFLTAIKAVIQVSPETYKTKILTSNEDKFRLMRLIGSWTQKELRTLATSLQNEADEVTVVMMIPFIKTVYQHLLKIYYIGETKIPNYFKEVYADLVKYPKADKKKIQKLVKACITEWFFVYSKMIKGFYPLLMRMCCNHFEYFQDFFLTQTANIFKFLEITKYDLIIPSKKKENHTEELDSVNEPRLTEEEKRERQVTETEKEKAERKKNEAKDFKMKIVQSGINLLDRLFPKAGFSDLKSMPDMYPYFQPLFQFREGYNLLSPSNPLQITVTLLRITEDLFQGFRNITFTEENEDTETDEKLSVVLSEWSVYREVLFEKQYGEMLKEFVDQQYTSTDFRLSLYGKKIITSLLWQTKYNFLPHFEFTQILLEKPKNDSQYRALCFRTEFLYNFFLALVKNIDASAKTKGQVLGIKNPWDKYNFDIPNPISKRMDVLLGAKRPPTETAATNANLIKYGLCIIAVLDWWVNDKNSPAYSTDGTKIYRVSNDEGAPEFSTPLRSDQSTLFAEGVKAAARNREHHA